MYSIMQFRISKKEYQKDFRSETKFLILLNHIYIFSEKRVVISLAWLPALS